MNRKEFLNLWKLNPLQPRVGNERAGEVKKQIPSSKRIGAIMLFVLLTAWPYRQEARAELTTGKQGDTGGAEDMPLWDLARNGIPADLQKGKVKQVGHEVILEDGAAFAVPAAAFPDQKNFTVQVTIRLPELENRATQSLMNRQNDNPDETDNGFEFSVISYIKKDHRPVLKFNTSVNNIRINRGRHAEFTHWQQDRLYTLTTSVQDGYASFYADGILFNRCLMQIIPNNEPMWIGNTEAGGKSLKAVITGVKVHGSSYKYITTRRGRVPDDRGDVGGKGWRLDVPKHIKHPEWSKVLIYGDSIMGGYRKHLDPILNKNRAYLFACSHYVYGEVPQAALEEMAARYPFDVIVFNNGLHSLHWTPERVSDETVYQRMRDLARCFKKGAPQARIFYLLTTPLTAKGKPVTGLDPVNDVVIRLNNISTKVMQGEGIEVIDTYSLLVNRLDLARGDRYHWDPGGTKLIADKVASKVLPVIQPPQ